MRLIVVALALLVVNRPASAEDGPPRIPTLFLVGDSTVKTGTKGQQGWGDPIIAMFDATKIKVENRAIGGRSSRTFINEGRWDKVLDAAKPGDFVLIQMGHNDGGALDDPSRARGSIRGIGDESREIDNPITKKKEVVHTYGWYLRKYVADARAKGMTPILVSPIPHAPRQQVQPEEIEGSRYVAWSEEVAKAEKVDFVHLNKIVMARYAAMTPEAIKATLFTPADGTHTSPAGAALNASCVVEGLRGLGGCRLKELLRPDSLSRVFDLGPGEAAPGSTRVLPDMIYTQERGYGFEPGSTIVGIDRGGDALRGDFCTSDRPFFFSVAVPEGNYRVTVTLGDPAGESVTTVKAEVRRLMLENISHRPGAADTRTFAVNVRTPMIAGGGEVRLKDRERDAERWAWDEKLTLEFSGMHPCVAAIEITPVDLPTVYLLGDSTVCDQPREPYASWGQMLPRFLGPGVAVANHAESGESLRSSSSARRFDKVLSTIRQGDYLLLQYGHNDMKATTAALYKVDFGRIAADASAKGATVVLVTPVNRRTFAGGTITDSLKDFPDAVRSLAKEGNYPLIDLNVMSKTLYETLGPEGSGRLFKAGDGTHHNNYGAYELARCVVEALRPERVGLAKFLAGDATPFDPARPDPFEAFKVPASPGAAVAPPEGK